jgi:hypothetical protein
MTMPASYELSLIGMSKQTHIHTPWGTEVPLRTRARKIYLRALEHIANELDGDDWPPLLLFLEPVSRAPESVAVPPALLAALDPDLVRDLLIPWLIDALGVQALGLVEQAACVEAEVTVQAGAAPEVRPLAMSNVVMVHVVDGDGHDCWVTQLADLQAGQPDWQQIEAEVGLFGGPL